MKLVAARTFLAVFVRIAKCFFPIEYGANIWYNASMSTYAPTETPHSGHTIDTADFARDFSSARKAPVRQASSADDGFTAPNGTYQFANTSAKPRSAAPAHASGTSGSSRPPQKRRKKKKNRWGRFTMFLLLFAVLALIVAVIIGIAVNCGSGSTCVSPANDPSTTASPNVSDDDTIAANVTINGVSVQGMTVASARAAVATALEQERATVAITISYEGVSQVLTADQIGLSYTADALNAALAEAVAAKGAKTLTVSLTHDDETLQASLYAMNDSIQGHAVNAKAEVLYETYDIDGATCYKPYFSYTDGTSGMQIDYDAVLAEVEAAIQSGAYQTTITPTVSVSTPAVTTEMLKAQTTLLSSYSTSYRYKKSSGITEEEYQNAVARDHNISKASGLMRVLVLNPGEVFSFNDTTGNRAVSTGWEEANAVYNQGYRKEAGGGVCQVSTTMYNALLRAGVTKYIRTGHSIPSDYVTSKYVDGLGFDATVDYGHIDFKFTNTLDNTIYVFIYITKDATSGRRKDIVVEVYGTLSEAGLEYRCRNEIVEQTPYAMYTPEITIDKNMSADDDPIVLRNPHDGYKVNIYVDQYVNGVFVKTVYTEYTEYKMIQLQQKVGSAVTTSAPVTTPKPSETDDPGDVDIPVIP